MWDAIAAFIKSFNEKYLIPLVISIVVAISAIIVLPGDYWMISKIGAPAFGVVVGGISFLVVLLFYYAFLLIKKKLYEASDRRYRIAKDQIQKEKNIRAIWTRIDHFSPEEREIIRKLVTSENQPVATNMYTFYSPESLFESEIMISTTVDDQNRYLHVYKLKEDYYQILKYSLEKYNKISNFD